ncbi:MAG TPA: glycosyltransferase family 39 protein [Pyrinomonadaceae bacterium]|nr:glycosyltransferase family 39 protein [Pyrinomonadaceae bacterium]
MNALLAVIALAMGAAIAMIARDGASAVLLCAAVAIPFGVAIARIEDQRTFMLQIFVSGLLVRVFIGFLIHNFSLQDFFGGDANTYDLFGNSLFESWRGDTAEGSAAKEWATSGGGWGMLYIVAGVYRVTGRNMLAVQFFNAVVGAATAPVIFLCARHIFQNLRVARLTAFFVAFFPSLVLWSSQGLKDGPIIFLLAVSMLATLKLGEKLSAKYFVMLVLALFAIMSLRFYVFYMLAAAIGGSFLVGMRRITSQSLGRQVVIVLGVGLALTYLGVLRGAGAQIEYFGNLQQVQVARSDLATSANSGFAQDVDVSTTAGALTAIPIGLVYLLFAPFPWQLANLRQSITLPEMLVWWGSFPMLVLGLWFTVKYRLRQALPILIFTSMLTLAYSIFQGNVGTAYRQRAQLLVFYFIFVAVGAVLLKERQETRQESMARAKGAAAAAGEARAEEARRRYEQWKHGREKELEEIARGLSERINF